MHSNTIKIIKQMDIIVNTEQEKIGNSTENTHIKTFFCASFIKQTCCPVFIFSYSKKRRHKIKQYVRFLRTLQQHTLFSLFRNVPATRFAKGMVSYSCMTVRLYRFRIARQQNRRIVYTVRLFMDCIKQIERKCDCVALPYNPLPRGNEFFKRPRGIGGACRG